MTMDSMKQGPHERDLAQYTGVVKDDSRLPGRPVPSEYRSSAGGLALSKGRTCPSRVRRISPKWGRTWVGTAYHEPGAGSVQSTLSTPGGFSCDDAPRRSRCSPSTVARPPCP